MARSRHRAALGRAALLLAASGCGYRFVTPGEGLPGGVRRVCAPVLVNRTAEPAVEALFSQALRAHLVRQGLAAEEGCDATLRGEVVALGSGVGMAAPGRRPVYRATATLRFSLQQEDTVLATVEVSGGEDFFAGDDVLASEANREAALHRLAEDLTREALDRLALRG